MKIKLNGWYALLQFGVDVHSGQIAGACDAWKFATIVGMDSHSYRDSVVEYCRALGFWGWTLYVGFFGSLVGTICALAGVQGLPLWVWITAMVATAVLAPFQAFHRMRVGFRGDLAKAQAVCEQTAKISQQTEENYRERFSNLENQHKKEVATIGRDYFDLQGKNAELQSQLDTREKIRQFRDKMSDFLAIGYSLGTSFVDGADIASLSVRANEWVSTVSVYLKHHAPDASFERRFVYTRPFQPGSIPKHVPASMHVDFAQVGARMEVIRELINEAVA